jgi:acyl-CoA hydrolase
MIGDAVVDLIEAGAVTNATKPIDRGVSVTGALIGTERLYRFADSNPGIAMRGADYTHGEAALSRLETLVTINAAIEVDLSGQVNAEQIGEAYVGGVGGQADFVRAGHRARLGHAIIALPSSAGGGAVSRIVPRLGGYVTTARSDVDVVVTEYGAAALRGCGFAERARRMIAIAHPDHRETLTRSAHALLRGVP